MVNISQNAPIKSRSVLVWLIFKLLMNRYVTARITQIRMIVLMTCPACSPTLGVINASLNTPFKIPATTSINQIPKAYRNIVFIFHLRSILTVFHLIVNIFQVCSISLNVPSVSEVLRSRIWAEHSEARYALLGEVAPLSHFCPFRNQFF